MIRHGYFCLIRKLMGLLPELLPQEPGERSCSLSSQCFAGCTSPSPRAARPGGGKRSRQLLWQLWWPKPNVVEKGPRLRNAKCLSHKEQSKEPSKGTWTGVSQAVASRNTLGPDSSPASLLCPSSTPVLKVASSQSHPRHGSRREDQSQDQEESARDGPSGADH